MRRLAAAQLAALVAFLAPAAAGASLEPAGDRQAIETASLCNNEDPAVAALAAGGFVIAWNDADSLFAQRLDAAGKPLGPALALAAGSPRAVEVVGFAGGGYAVAWFDPSRTKVLARFVDGAGVPGDELVVGSAGPNSGDGFGGLDATRGPGGTLAVAWTSGESVLLRELRADGSALTPQAYLVEAYFHVTGFRSAAFSPAIMVAPDDSLLVFWILGSLLPYWNDSGSVEGKRLVHGEPAAGGYAVVREVDGAGAGRELEGAIAADGSYLLAWALSEYSGLPLPPPGGPKVQVRGFFAADTPRGAPVVIDAGHSHESAALSVVAVPSGGFVVGWQTEQLAELPPFNTFVLAREVDPAGVPRGPIADLTVFSYGQARPDLAVAPDGLLLAAWQDLPNPFLGPACLNPQVQVSVRPFRSAGGLSLHGGRFELTLEYFDPRRGLAGSGRGVALTSDSGYFWFFDSGNVEVVVKVLDGRAVNGRWWFFWGGLTDLGLRLTLRDTATGATKTYESAPGGLVSAADVAALPAAVAATSAVSVQRLHRFGLDHEAFVDEGGPSPAAVPSSQAAPATATLASAAPPCSSPALPVVPGPGLCLTGERFEVTATWRTGGREGAAGGVKLGDESGYLWFFAPENVELMVKVLDGRPVNGRFWVFHAALTDVEYDLVVRHETDGTEWRYHNPAGQMRSGADTSALEPPDCECPAVLAPVCGRDGRIYGNSCEAYCVGWVGIAPFEAPPSQGGDQECVRIEPP